MSDRLDEAKKFMQKAHEGQTRWDKSPYANHPIKVVNLLKDLGVTDEVILCAGYLHDVIEDTKIGRLDIKRKFGEDVANLVEELTFEDGISDHEYHVNVTEMSDNAKMIKLADIIANISDNGKKSTHFLQKRSIALLLILQRLLNSA